MILDKNVILAFKNTQQSSRGRNILKIMYSNLCTIRTLFTTSLNHLDYWLNSFFLNWLPFLLTHLHLYGQIDIAFVKSVLFIVK